MTKIDIGILLIMSIIGLIPMCLLSDRVRLLKLPKRDVIIIDTATIILLLVFFLTLGSIIYPGLVEIFHDWSQILMGSF
jgi:uncharacterized membrane protein YdcZ (DUF606 family)